MILAVKKSLREAKWIWILIATSMLWGKGVLYFFKNNENKKSIKSINGESLSLQMFKSRMKREEIMRDQLRRWGLKIGSPTSREIMKNCEREIILNWLTKKNGFKVDDISVGEEIKKQLGEYVIDENKVNAHIYKMLIKQQGQDSIEDFEEDIRKEKERKLFSELLKSLSAIEEKIVPLSDKRSFSWLELKEESNNIEKTITDEDFEEYYKIHKTKYMDGGFVKLGLFEIDKKEIGKKIQATESEIVEYYNKNKEKKYINPKSYTFDTWIFNSKKTDGALANETELKTFTESLSLATLEDFEKAKKEAKKKALDLGVMRNYKIVLGKGKVDKKIEKELLLTLNETEFSNCFELDGKLQMIRLIKKDSASTKQLQEVRNEIEELFKKRKAENKVIEISEKILKRLKNIKKLTSGEINEILSEIPEEYKLSVRYRERKTGEDGSEAGGIQEFLTRADTLEAGRSGKISDESKDVVYLIETVTKSKQQSYEEVKKDVQDELIKEKTKESIEKESIKIKTDLLKSGNWTEDKKVNFIENATKEDVEKKLKLNPEAVNKIFKLISTKQVLIEETAEGLIIISLNENVETQKELLSGGGEEDYLEDVLALFLKNARIEEYTSVDENSRRSVGRDNE